LFPGNELTWPKAFPFTSTWFGADQNGFRDIGFETEKRPIDLSKLITRDWPRAR